MRNAFLAAGLIAAAAAPAHALDLIGGASWDELRLELALNGRTGTVEDSDHEIDLMQVAIGASNVSGYRFSHATTSGCLLGAKATVNTWFDQDQVIDYTVAGPIVAVSAGLWQELGERARVEIAPEIGVGVAIASYRPSANQASSSVDSEAFLHYGMHVRLVADVSETLTLGLDGGYEVDRLPYIEAHGFTLGLIVGF